MATKDETQPLTPGPILGLSSGYWKSFALQTAVTLDVFTHIGGDQLTGADVATRVGCDERGVTTLLNAIVALGLLTKHDGRFANTQATRLFLVKSSPRYVGFLIRHHANLAESWVRLVDAVKSGEPVRPRSSGSSGDTQESFLLGMHVQAMGIAPRAVRDIDLGGRSNLLDLGGGPGTWAIHFAMQNPSVHATVFDLPGSRPFAEQTIAQFELTDRVKFHGGDFVSNDLPRGFDVAWLSHILHGEGPETCRSIIRKVVAALDKNGLVLVHEFILDPDMTSPTFPALFSLNMLLGTPGGRSYARGELEKMLGEAGVRDMRILPFLGPTESRILVGVV